VYKYAFLILFLNFSFLYSFAQTLNYKVTKGGKQIGKILANRQVKADSCIYQLETEVSIRFIATFNVASTFETRYFKNRMVAANTINYLNGDLKEYSKTRWKNGVYHFERDEEKMKLDTNLIEYCIADLYYNEPKGISSIFSERFGKFCTLKETEPHTYELTLPNGKQNYYTYKAGVCQKVEVNLPLATIYFELEP